MMHVQSKSSHGLVQQSPRSTPHLFLHSAEISFNSFFKSDFIQSLKERKKNLHLKFEVLTLKSLSEAFDSGCRILQLTLDFVHEEGLIAEDSEANPHLVPYQKLKEMIHECRLRSRKSFCANRNSLGEKNVELIILACKNHIKLAEFFSKEICIPFVITFMFKSRDAQDSRENARIALYENEFIEKFNMFFFVELVDGRSVQKSFDAALRNAFDCIACSFFLGKEILVKELLGEGAVLLLSPDNTEAHNRKLFGSDEFELLPGMVEDISTVLSPTNIQKSILPWVGRKGEIFEIIKLLGQEEKTNFLKVTGDPGSGKTRLVLEAAYYMLVRNHFPDGVFYFPLRKYWKTNLLDMLKKVLNSEGFSSNFDKNIKNLFRNKKMLLIFDDFDSFYENMVEFPYLIFSVLQLCQISTIVVTTSNNVCMLRNEKSYSVHKSEDVQAKIEHEFIKSTMKVPRLTLEESGLLISALTEIEFGSNASTEEIIKLTAVKQAKGNPARLIKLIKEDKIFIEDKTLKLNPNYLNELDLDKKYKGLVKKPRSENEKKFALNVSRHSSIFYSTFIQQEHLKHKRSHSRFRNQKIEAEEEDSTAETPDQSNLVRSIIRPRTKTLEVKLAQQMSMKLAKSISSIQEESENQTKSRSISYIPPESSEDDDVRETRGFSAYAAKLVEKNKKRSLVLDEEDEEEFTSSPEPRETKEIAREGKKFDEKSNEHTASEHTPGIDEIDESLLGKIARRKAIDLEAGHRKEKLAMMVRGKSESGLPLLKYTTNKTAVPNSTETKDKK